MFGTNPLRRPIVSNGMELSIVETFHTIQGEGPLAGLPATFVRLAGCNLRCHFCDTDFESNTRLMDINALLLLISPKESPMAERRLVVITGGEPLRQEIGPFCDELLCRGHAVQVETAGTVWPSLGLPEAVDIVCSPKTGHVHPEVYRRCRDWKYIVGSGDHPVDLRGLPTAPTQERNGRPQHLAKGEGQVWLQPRFDYIDGMEPDVAANERNVQRARDLCLIFGHRLSLQIHKMIGLP